MPDEKDLHDPRNPCYDDEQRKLFISKPKFPKQATSTTDRDEAVGNKPLPHFEKEEITFEDGSKGSVLWIPMPGVDYQGKLPIEKSIKEALNDTTEPTYKESNPTLQDFNNMIEVLSKKSKEPLNVLVIDKKDGKLKNFAETQQFDEEMKKQIRKSKDESNDNNTGTSK